MRLSASPKIKLMEYMEVLLHNAILICNPPRPCKYLYIAWPMAVLCSLVSKLGARASLLYAGVR